jgi:hypothetical protein
MPDFISDALSALKLPARIVAGLFLFCLLTLALDHFGLIPVAAIHPLALPLLILGAALTGLAYSHRAMRSFLRPVVPAPQDDAAIEAAWDTP